MMDFFQMVINFFTNDLYVWGYETIVEWTSWFVIGTIEAEITFLEFSWDVAKDVLETLNITAQLNDAWGNIDSGTMGYLTFFRLPECLSIILNAGATRVVMQML